MVAELGAEAAGALDAGVGDHADHHDALDGELLQLVVEIGVGEAARVPVFLDQDVAWLHLEIVVERATPGSLGEALALGRAQLRVGRMPEAFVVAQLPSAMRDEEDL